MANRGHDGDARSKLARADPEATVNQACVVA
jgi:hypothetical protein